MYSLFTVFYQFLTLGCTSFGGPAAHIGYFRYRFVEQLNWLNGAEYAQCVALSQVLPGPASSQLGFSIGLRKAGVFGGVASFIGFTLPSSILMLFLVIVPVTTFNKDIVYVVGIGLSLLACIVIIDATLQMAKQFCNLWLYRGIAIVSFLFLLIFHGLLAQILVLIMMTVVGVIANQFFINTRNHASDGISVNRNASIAPRWFFLIAFICLFITLPILTKQYDVLTVFSQFYQAGSLVFGGGHVVLPLLQSVLSNNIDGERFLMAYSAAQAVPGPMFSMAAFLGAELMPSSQVLGAVLATSGIFLPGFLLLIAFEKSWQGLMSLPWLSAATMAVNASIVGLLASVLGHDIFLNIFTKLSYLIVIVIGLFLLRYYHFSVFILIIYSLIAAFIVNMNLFLF